MYAALAVARESQARSMTDSPENEGQMSSDEWGNDPRTQAAARELLELLPGDVRRELNSGEIDLRDPSFLDGLVDHVSRLPLAQQGNQRILQKVIRLRKLMTRNLRAHNQGDVVSSTISRDSARTGRNAPCPCGSGRKYKHCCLRK